ncbi:MAG: hypothetical protein ABEI06_04815 [Halobacteriaceae archaeon]
MDTILSDLRSYIQPEKEEDNEETGFNERDIDDPHDYSDFQ